MQLQHALLASFAVTMVSVLPPLFAAMERLVVVGMAVMREDAVSWHGDRIVDLDKSACTCPLNSYQSSLSLSPYM